ncbi:hypothetical protein B9Z36_08145 [Limnohabitans sp. Rim8]|nr:hypothetical protein B9Z36_08145 [Limnohabitans sp. Rim8]
MGAELLGGTAATSTSAATLMGSTVYGAAANAGIAALASSAGVSFVNNGGDIGKTLKDMGSSQNVKGVLTAMVTAGVLTELGSSTTATGQTGANAQAISTTQAVDKFTANLMQNVTNNMASAVVSSAINGTPLNEDTLSTALSSALITAGMAQTANSIGAATQNGTLNAYTQAMAHALAGCVGGAATTGNSGGCSAGAVGAVVGELSAKLATENKMDAGSALKLATTMSAVAGALVGGPDSAAAVNVASQMGTNAALNNYLNHVKPSLMELSEVEKYNRAVAECGLANQGACALRDELASLSAQRDRSLALACNGQAPDLCGSLARQAVAMGNLVRGSNGEFVYANSPQSGAIQGLNTATISAVSRPENFHDQASASTAQGLALVAVDAAGTAVAGKVIQMGVKAQTIPLTGGASQVGTFQWGGSAAIGFASGAGTDWVINPNSTVESAITSGIGGAISGAAKLGLNAQFGLANQWVPTTANNLMTTGAAKAMGTGAAAGVGSLLPVINTDASKVAR